MIKGKRGSNILTENIIFIVLNLVFLTILVAFLISRMGTAAVFEEKYSKQIAMIIDSAKPLMNIELDMSDAIKEKNAGVENIVSIQGNVVNVNLRENGKGSSYSFFNDIEITNYYFNGNKFVLIMDKYNP